MHDQSIALIPLRARSGAVRAYAIVDAEDADRLNRYRWSLRHADRAGGGYAYRGFHTEGRVQHVLMHREILGLPPGRLCVEVDHFNHRTLDNRKANLRVVTHAENMQNTVGVHANSRSRFRGALYQPSTGKWRARVAAFGRSYYFGTFATEEEAGRAAAAGRAVLHRSALDNATTALIA